MWCFNLDDEVKFSTQKSALVALHNISWNFPWISADYGSLGKTSGGRLFQSLDRLQTMLLLSFTSMNARNVTLQSGWCGKVLMATDTRIWPLTGMCSHMYLHHVGTAKLFTAEIAGKWFLSRMHSHVCNKTAALRELLLADVAFIRALAGVGSFVIPKGTRVCKLLVAGAAGKWLFARMDSHVHLQSCGPLELHPAQLAAELWLADMDRQVLFQIARLRKPLLTDEAHVRLCAIVGTHVQPQVVWFQEFPAANVTGIQLFTRVASLVSVISARMAELSFTNVARVRHYASVCAQMLLHAPTM